MTIEISDETKVKAMIFNALSDPIRIEFLLFLEEEKCVCEIVKKFDIIQPLASRHLKILKDSGLVSYRKEGNKRLYKVTILKILDVINNLTPKVIDDVLEILTKKIIKK